MNSPTKKNGVCCSRCQARECPIILIRLAPLTTALTGSAGRVPGRELPEWRARSLGPPLTSLAKRGRAEDAQVVTTQVSEAGTG